jgi:ATP-dependent protease HslVU (ClpYQ) peptidase subunit
LVALGSEPAPAAVTNAIWLGGGGNWSQNTNWSTGGFPNNGGGNNYVAWIDQGNAVNSTVTQDVSVTINALNVSMGDRLLVGDNIALWVDDGISGGTITNAGTITLSPVTGVSHLRPGSRVVLAGGGSVTLGGNGNGYIFGLISTNLLINLDNTIQGAGWLGYNAMGLANSGTIDANQPGASLVVDPTDALIMTNTATMQASNGGRMQLLGGTFFNTGIIRAQSNSTVELNVATIIGGTLTNTASGLLLATGHSTLSNVTQSGHLAVTNAVYVVLAGTITNRGVISVGSTVNESWLRPVNNTVLTGGGVIELNQHPGDKMFGWMPSDVLINQDNTIRGAGLLGSDYMGLVNAGTVDANMPGAPLVVDPDNSLVVTNTGTMQARNGGRLRLLGGTFFNAGVIRALSNSTVELSVATIIGGTLTNAATGLLLATGPGTLSNVTQCGHLVVSNAVYVVLAGTITNRGVISLGSTVNESWLRPVNNTVLAGGGVIELNQYPGDKIFGSVPSDVLINQDNTIRGAGLLGNDYMGLVNAGTVDANMPGAFLVVDPDNFLVVTNTGTMQASNGGRLQLLGGRFFNSGTIRALNSSTVEVTTATIIGGTLTNAATGLIAVTGPSTLSNLTQSGHVAVNNQIILYVGGTITNRGTISLNATSNETWLRLTSDTVLAGGGFVQLSTYPNDVLWGYAGNERLINEDNTIQGAGRLGANALGLDNRGTILANQPGSTLLIDPNDTLGFLNRGTLQANVNCTLYVAGPGFSNFVAATATLTGGTYRVAGTLKFDSAHVVHNAAALILDSATWRIVDHLGTSALTHFSTNTGNVTLQNGAVFHSQTNFVNGTSACALPAELTVHGGSLYITNTAGNATLDLRSGTVALIAGLIQVDRLVITNGCARFIKTGGTLVVNGTLNLSPDLDADGDGFLNADESNFGSDPLSPDSVPAVLGASPSTLLLGPIATGMTARASFVVTNASSFPFTGTAQTGTGPFAIVSGSPFTLPGFGSTNIIVGFTPTAHGAVTNSVIFTSNGGDATATVIGTGVAFPPGDVNGTNGVTGADSLLINQVIVGLRSNTHPIFTAAGFTNGDVNATNGVTGADSLLINQVLVGLRPYITTLILPASRFSNETTAVMIFGIGFPTNQVPAVTIGAPVNLTLTNVAVLSRERIIATVPPGGGLGTGAVNVVSSPTNGVISFGRFINQ